MSIDGFIEVISYWRFIAKGLGLTVWIAAVSIVAGSILGLVVALMRLTPHWAINWPARLYIDFVRSTPILVQLLWVYFALPILTGVSLTPLVAAIGTLSFHSGPFLGEVFRAGILSVERGQKQAAFSLGMRPVQVFMRVVWPQAFGRMLPPTGNIFISLIKNSALASVVGVSELMWKTQAVGGYTFEDMEAFTVAAAVYVVFLIIPMSQLINFVNRRMSPEAIGGRR